MATRKTKTQDIAPIETLIPAQFAYLLSYKPVLWCEDEGQYDQLLADILAQFKPQTIIDYSWVKTLVDTQWDIMRCQRLKTAALAAEMPDATRDFLGYDFDRIARKLGLEGGSDTLTRTIRLATKGNDWCQTKLDDVVDLAGITYDTLLYKSYAAGAATLSDISNRILKLEQRRDDLIKRYEERQRSLAAHRKSLLDQGSDISTIKFEQTLASDNDK